MMLIAPQTETDAAWKARFRAPIVAFTQMAEDAPERGLAVSDRSGIMQLYAWDVPSGDLRQLTDLATGKSSGVIAPDGHYVYYLDETRGDETGHYMRVPFAGGAAQDITPEMPPYTSLGLAASRRGRQAAFTVVAPGNSEVYLLDFAPDGTPGEPRLLYASHKMTSNLQLSADGRFLLLANAGRSEHLEFRILVFDVDSGQQLAELYDQDASVQPVRFARAPGDNRVLGFSNRTGTKRPLIWNPESGERLDLPVDDLEGEIIPADWSADGREILLVQFDKAVQTLHIYDLASQTRRRLNHPAGSYDFFGGAGTYFTPQGDIFAQWQNAEQPTRLIALDPQTGEQTRTVLALADVPAGRPWRSITFSSDGYDIQAWLATPQGDGPFPTILHTHGGPTAVMTERFHPGAQAWLDHGFAFLSVNYRGSVSFGRDFERAIWGKLGQCESDDMVAAYDWLAANGIAHPEQIFLSGGSYGGYLTLLGLGKSPDLWAGGMGTVVVADWRLMYEDMPGPTHPYLVALFGGTPEERPEAYAAGSPITYVEQVQAPLLVIQGRNDIRCPARQYEVYEAQMKTAGKHIETHWFDAGHLSLDTDKKIEFQELMLDFAYRVLNGGLHG